MDILENNIYDFTIITIMHFVLIFDLLKMKSTAKKYKLVYCSIQKPLLLDYLILCPLYKSNKKDKIIEVEL